MNTYRMKGKVVVSARKHTDPNGNMKILVKTKTWTFKEYSIAVHSDGLQYFDLSSIIGMNIDLAVLTIESEVIKQQQLKELIECNI